MLSSSKLLIDNGSPGTGSLWGPLYLPRQCVYHRLRWKIKLNIYRDVRPTMAVRKSEINLQFTKKNTFVTASFKKYQITLKTRWIFQDWKVTTFDQTCQHRAKSGSQEIWTHRFVHLGSKQCPTSIKFTFFFIFWVQSHMYESIPPYILPITPPTLCHPRHQRSFLQQLWFSLDQQDHEEILNIRFDIAAPSGVIGYKIHWIQYTCRWICWCSGCGRWGICPSISISSHQ